MTREEMFAARNAKIAAAYSQPGADIAKIAKRHKLDPGRISRIAIAAGALRKNAPRKSGVSAGRAMTFVSPDALPLAEMAARARGLTIGRLASRIVNAALTDAALLDNVLDDGVRTQVPHG